MKKFWFYLEPYSFVFEGKQGIVIYNTLNGKIIQCNDDLIVHDILNQLKERDSGYCTLLTQDQINNKSVEDFVENIRNTFSGDIIDCDLSHGKPFILKPILNLLNDPEKTLQGKGYTLRENVLDYVHEVNIYINTDCTQGCSSCKDYYKQFLCCTECNTKFLLSVEEYKILFDYLSVIGVQKINILGGNLSQNSLFYSLLQLIEHYRFKKYIYLSYKNIKPNFISQMKDIDGLTVYILVEELFELNIFHSLMKYSDIRSVKWQFIVSTEKEYYDVNKLTDELGIDGEIIPFFNKKNIDFFEKYVYLELDDILSEPISRQKIYSRQVLNENLFGKLTVMPDGDVYANVNNLMLGNIKNNRLNELIYKEIARSDSWLKKREGKPCSSCTYRFLCPSPGNYELVMEKLDLCHVLSNE